METERLRLRQLTLEDADFIVELLNDSAFLRYIGDKGVRTADDAREYLEKGPLAAYRSLGFGMYLVVTKEGDERVGICGLNRRAGLDDVDLGFAYLPEFRGRGYGLEAGAAVLDHAARDLRLDRIVAVTALDNAASSALLEKLGLRFDREIRLPGDSQDCRLFVSK